MGTSALTETRSTRKAALTPTPTGHFHGNPSPSFISDAAARAQRMGEEPASSTSRHLGHDFGQVRVSGVPAFQPKLTIGQPGDRYEQEADRIADTVMGMTGATAASPQELPAIPLPQRQAHGSAATPLAEPPLVHQALSSPGRPLDAGARRFLEPRLGHDFSRVQVHTGARAAASARALNALAYTVGHNIVLGSGQYAPHTTSGLRLLAHELTHVVQQSGVDPAQGMNLTSAPIGPVVQRYTAYDTADQSTGKSLGWIHPGTEDLRVSDDGILAVEDKGWNPGSNKRAWARKAQIKQSNDTLKAVGSNTKLLEKAGTITGKPPSNPKAKSQTLVEIEPQKSSGVGTFSLISDCGSACKQVMGSHGGTDVAVLGGPGKQKYTSARTYHGGTPTTPEEFFQEILKMEFGPGFTRAELYDKYSKLSASKKDAFDRKYGINKYASPQVGQGQTISTETDMPGFATTGAMTWNFHYAATVLRSGPDHVTLESAAGWGPTDWIFYMYGPAKKAQSFHEEHGAMGSHGTHYTTMVVQPEARLKGKTNAPGVHLVADPAKWDTTLIAKLPNGTDVYTLRKDMNWQKVRVETGPHAGKVGWIVIRYFSE